MVSAAAVTEGQTKGEDETEAGYDPFPEVTRLHRVTLHEESSRWR
jgi:hypothetical protein